MFFLKGSLKKEHFKKTVHILMGAFRPKHKCGNLDGDMFCAVMARDFGMLLILLWAFFLCCSMDAFALLSLLPPDDAPLGLGSARASPAHLVSAEPSPG